MVLKAEVPANLVLVLIYSCLNGWIANGNPIQLLMQGLWDLSLGIGWPRILIKIGPFWVTARLLAKKDEAILVDYCFINLALVKFSKVLQFLLYPLESDPIILNNVFLMWIGLAVLLITVSFKNIRRIISCYYNHLCWDWIRFCSTKCFCQGRSGGLEQVSTILLILYYCVYSNLISTMRLILSLEMMCFESLCN